MPPPGVVLKPGDDVRFSDLVYGGVPQHTAMADFDTLRILGHGPAPVARPATTADIAKQLGISLDMVKEHTEALFQKLGVANRPEAVAIALRKHLLKI